tara:strand:+ start:5463 stop:5648 length:186 start_codon:yes stop_codon:yes gene_type:complete
MAEENERSISDELDKISSRMMELIRGAEQMGYQIAQKKIAHQDDCSILLQRIAVVRDCVKS